MSGSDGRGPDYLRALYGLFDVLSSIRESEEDKVWIRVIEKLAVELDTEGATYFLVAHPGRELTPRYAVGVSPERLSQVRIEIGRGVCGWVAAHREALLVPDATQDSRFLREVDEAPGFKTRSILCVPLLDRLDLTGVVELVNKRRGPFTPEDLRFVAEACRQTSTTLRVLRLETMLNKVTAHNANILENLTGGFLAADLRGRVIICNPAARRILELREEVVGKNVDEALAHVAGLAEILTKTLVTRQTLRRQDLRWSFQGEGRVLGYSTMLIQDHQGNFTGAGLTFQDISAFAGKPGSSGNPSA